LCILGIDISANAKNTQDRWNNGGENECEFPTFDIGDDEGREERCDGLNDDRYLISRVDMTLPCLRFLRERVLRHWRYDL
jgi:hypothetical protein